MLCRTGLLRISVVSSGVTKCDIVYFLSHVTSTVYHPLMMHLQTSAADQQRGQKKTFMGQMGAWSENAPVMSFSNACTKL